MLLFGCKSYNPTTGDVVGTWIAEDEALLQFNKDGTFNTKKINGDKFLSKEYKGLIFNETGSWEFGKSHLDQWVVFLRFNRSARLTKGFSTFIMILDNKGFFENKLPWYLYLFGEDEEGEWRYKFIEQYLLEVQKEQNGIK